MNSGDSQTEFVIQAFPRLRGSAWKVTSPETVAYNGVAWANEDENRWWWPGAGYYWPSSVPAALSVEAFVTLFVSVGYSLADNGDLEAGQTKIAIFANELGPSHVARQLPGGEWTSKLGSSVDVLLPPGTRRFTLWTCCAIHVAASRIKVAPPTTLRSTSPSVP